MLGNQERLDASGIGNCLRDNPPPCTCGCYFDFDVRGFVNKVKRGATGAAYRAYKSAVVFPEVISILCDAPCKRACILGSGGDALDIPSLERAAVELTANKTPRDIGLPAKDREIAIVGGGISGLACAQRLSSKGYRVVVYEREAILGGALRELLPQGLLEAAAAREFQHLNVRFCTGHVVEQVDSLDADAVFIAVRGEEGKRLLAASSAPRPVLSEPLADANAAARCASGLKAATELESLLLIGRTLPDRVRPAPTPCFAPEQPSFAVRPSGSVYTASEAMDEAGRCRQCKCSECIKACGLMQSYRLDPVKIRHQILATLKTDDLERKSYARMADACTFCGKCTEVCPQKVDLCQMLRTARCLLNDGERLPPPYHEFWINDMDNAAGQNEVLLTDGSDCEYLFFPGCQLGASMPEYVLESYNMLKSTGADIGAFVSCCGAPAEWAGKSELLDLHIKKLLRTIERCGNPTVIFACPNCMKQFARFLPSVKAASLYDIWLKWGLPVPAGSPCVSLTVFDPCTVRGLAGFTDSVREILNQAGIAYSELPEDKIGRCCGFGGHISVSNPRTAQELAKERISYSELPYLTYCSNCRDTFAQNGKRCWHILDILCRLPERNGESPGLSQRRKNRNRLRQLLTQTKGGESLPGFSIEIPDAVRSEMESAYILEENIISVIERCEKSGRKLFKENDGSFEAHLQLGEITVWVEYVIDGGRFVIRSVYSHRMKIGDGENAK